jgi:uncharacterized protein
MTFSNFTPVASLVGGLMIGLAASAVLVGCGRICGISGILANTLSPPKGEDGTWRVLFLAGLVVGGFLLSIFAPGAIGAPIVGSAMQAVVAGAFVGVGVDLGAGCTAGHGICGIGRLSPRSFVATATFVVTGMLTVLAMHRLAGAP